MARKKRKPLPLAPACFPEIGRGLTRTRSEGIEIGVCRTGIVLRTAVRVSIFYGAKMVTGDLMEEIVAAVARDCQHGPKKGGA